MIASGLSIPVIGKCGSRRAERCRPLALGRPFDLSGAKRNSLILANLFPVIAAKFPVIFHREFRRKQLKRRALLTPIRRSFERKLRNSLYFPCLSGNCGLIVGSNVLSSRHVSGAECRPDCAMYQCISTSSRSLTPLPSVRAFGRNCKDASSRKAKRASAARPPILSRMRSPVISRSN